MGLCILIMCCVRECLLPQLPWSSGGHGMPVARLKAWLGSQSVQLLLIEGLPLYNSVSQVLGLKIWANTPGFQSVLKSYPSTWLSSCLVRARVSLHFSRGAWQGTSDTLKAAGSCPQRQDALSPLDLFLHPLSVPLSSSLTLPF